MNVYIITAICISYTFY